MIVLYKKILSDFLTLHAIILALLESGGETFENLNLFASFYSGSRMTLIDLVMVFKIKFSSSA